MLHILIVPFKSLIIAAKNDVGISFGLPYNLNYSPGAPGLKAYFLPNFEYKVKLVIIP